MMEMDLQEFLKDMRAENREDHGILFTKLEQVHETAADHENRLQRVERVHKTARWLGASFILAAVGVVVDFVASHLPKAAAVIK